jgi:Flp pilus assembly pilin Flp
MTKIIASVRKFIENEDAPSMVEYALLLVLIALVVAATAATLGTNLASLFNTAATSV